MTGPSLCALSLLYNCFYAVLIAASFCGNSIRVTGLFRQNAWYMEQNEILLDSVHVLFIFCFKIRFNICSSSWSKKKKKRVDCLLFAEVHLIFFAFTKRLYYTSCFLHSRTFVLCMLPYLCICICFFGKFLVWWTGLSGSCFSPVKGHLSAAGVLARV